ncbi:MAG: sensor histidine kinase [Candidatus Promineifilaceae bacterium]
MSRSDNEVADRLLLISRISIIVALVLSAVSIWFWILRLTNAPMLDPNLIIIIWGAFNIGFVLMALLLYRVVVRVQAARQQMMENEQRLVLSEAKLTKSNAELEAFLFAIGHDLQEPLRGVRNFGDLLQRRHSASLDKQGQDYVRRMVRGAERMSELLQACMLLSQTRHIESREWISAEKIIEISLEQVDINRDQVEIAPNLPDIYANRQWSAAALTQLLSNAAKFKDAQRDAEILIEGYCDGHLSGFVVKDRGSGLPSGQSQKVFNLFQRGVGREVQGVGFGLTLVQQIAEQHGGAAWAEARAGGGSNFFMTFADEKGLTTEPQRSFSPLPNDGA